MLHPTEGALDCLEPALVVLVSFGSIHLGVHVLSISQFAPGHPGCSRSLLPDQLHKKLPGRWFLPPLVVLQARQNIRLELHQQLVETMPPSTFRATRGTPESCSWHPTPRGSGKLWLLGRRVRCGTCYIAVMPTITPRASDFQYGANNPENAGQSKYHQHHQLLKRNPQLC